MTIAVNESKRTNLLYLTTPTLWRGTYPFLPVIRHKGEPDQDLGVLYDAMGHTGRAGYSATVFLCNLFLLPATEEEFLALPREVYDTPEEVYAAGWRMD